jgi:hypothetical protein
MSHHKCCCPAPATLTINTFFWFTQCPVPSVAVVVKDSTGTTTVATGTTDAGGSWTPPGLAAGTYRIYTTKTGWTTASIVTSGTAYSTVTLGTSSVALYVDVWADTLGIATAVGNDTAHRAYAGGGSNILRYNGSVQFTNSNVALITNPSLSCFTGTIGSGTTALNITIRASTVGGGGTDKWSIDSGSGYPVNQVTPTAYGYGNAVKSGDGYVSATSTCPGLSGEGFALANGSACFPVTIAISNAASPSPYPATPITSATWSLP